MNHEKEDYRVSRKIMYENHLTENFGGCKTKRNEMEGFLFFLALGSVKIKKKNRNMVPPAAGGVDFVGKIHIELGFPGGFI